jgi:SPFH domain / Band 7 family
LPALNRSIGEKFHDAQASRFVELLRAIESGFAVAVAKGESCGAWCERSACFLHASVSGSTGEHGHAVFRKYAIGDEGQVIRSVLRPQQSALVQTTVATCLRINRIVAFVASVAIRRAVGVDRARRAATGPTAVRGAATTTTAAAAARARRFGVKVERVGVKDVVLPGEMKTLLNRVIEAEKEAQANVILRREEVAATRLLANTARVMADSPVLLRLEELKAMKEIAEKIGELRIVVGADKLGALLPAGLLGKSQSGN